MPINFSLYCKALLKLIITAVLSRFEPFSQYVFGMLCQISVSFPQMVSFYFID